MFGKSRCQMEDAEEEGAAGWEAAKRTIVRPGESCYGVEVGHGG